ncbi:MAG: ribonuclease Y [Candidatus Kerfeldbacteria bacterium]|nr:ribonuclease Y [Candidatus Kerfeldbacteria bacterium]
MEFIIGPIVLVVGLGFGTMLGYWYRKQVAVKSQSSAETKAETIVNEAKSKQQEILLQAKDKALKVLEEAKREETERRQDATQAQRRLEKRESLFDQKLLELETKQQRLQDKAKEIEQIKEKILGIKTEQLVQLEKVAQLDRTAAQQLLEQRVEEDVKEALLSRQRKLEQQGAEEIERRAKELMTVVIQRCSTSHAAETTTTTVTLPNDDLKGRIIGKEGRNIKRIEELTGVEIIIDDTPGAIVVSGFSPIRRHLAKRALDILLSDGRIHPTRIEEAVERAKKDLALDIKKAGEEALYEVGVTGFEPKLVAILGRLKYRTSYGQNVLRHSIEVAFLAAMLAEHLGANVNIARKGGLLHDIGKSVDHEVQGTHPEIGRDIAKKFGLSDEVIAPILYHHDDLPPTLEAIIVKVADAISGSRPGARKDTYENYIQRLEELENVALRFPGIEKAYAIQAGREVRVFVQPDTVDDYAAAKLAKEIATQIENELKYPGEIRITMIREKRIIEYAR